MLNLPQAFLRLVYTSLTLCVTLACHDVAAATPSGAAAAGTTCVAIGDFYVRLGQFARSHYQLGAGRGAGWHHGEGGFGYFGLFRPCKDISSSGNPELVIANETLLAAEQAPYPGHKFDATAIGDACQAEPQIAIYGNLAAFFSVENDRIRSLMRSVGTAIQQQCGTYPPTMHVKVQRRTVTNDPKTRATLKRPARKLIALEVLYQGRFFWTSEDGFIWADADPALREEAVNQHFAGRRADPLERARAYKEAVRAYELEHHAEISATFRALLEAAMATSIERHCHEILYGNTPHATTGTIGACMEILSRR